MNLLNKNKYIKKFDNLKIKYKKDPKKYSILLSSLILAFSLVIGSSYAYLTYISKTNNTTLIEAGTLALTFKNEKNSISLSNAVPITDNMGLEQEEEYEFSIENTGSLPANYTITLENTCTIGKSYIINNETFNVDKCIPNEYIKVGLKEGNSEYKVLEYNKEKNSYILDADLLNAKKDKTYKMKIWLDYDTPNDYNSKGELNVVYSGKLSLSYEQSIANLDTSGANAPIISSNMIPVYYDETCKINTGCWRKADSNNMKQKYKWYNYDEKMWANVVTVNSETRNYYLSADLGTEIKINDVNTMLVWIPRYKYKVWNYNLNGMVSSEPQEIQIEFEKDITSTGEIKCTDNISGLDGSVSEICKVNNTNCTDSLCNGKYYTHPSFTFGNDEVAGIWVSKFEVSKFEECESYDVSVPAGCFCNKPSIKPMVKPNVSSWKGAMIGTFDYAIRGMNDKDNIYGFASTDDTHMIKNSDWGAITYLSHSRYGTCDNGVCKTLSFNNNSDNITGVSSGSVPDDMWYEDLPNYKYNEIKKYSYSVVEGTGTIINPTIENDSEYPWSNVSGVYKSTNQYEEETSASLKFKFKAPNNETYLTFDWSVSSESISGDYLYYTIVKDGKVLNETGVITKIGGLNLGNEDESMQYLNVLEKLDAGNYELIFTYKKNKYSSDGTDTGYVKNVKILNDAKVNISSTIIGHGQDGPSASTTGNVYGIYDMSGSSAEFVMSRIVSPDGENLLSGYNSEEYSGYTGILYDDERYTPYTGIYTTPEHKYYDLYSFNTDAFNESFTKLGDATKEVHDTYDNRWYHSFFNNIQSYNPFFERGNWYQSGWDNGVYESASVYGSVGSEATRLIVIPNSPIMPDNTTINFDSLVCEVPNDGGGPV